MKICIFGYSGKIGTCLLKYLKSSKHEIFIVSRTTQNELNHINYIYCDIEFNSKKIRTLLQECDVAINLIGEYKKVEKMFNANVVTLQNLILEINKLKRSKKLHFIHLSSCSVYGYNSKSRSLNENSSLTPNNFYGKTKLQAEKILIRNANKFFSYTIIRPAGVITDNKSSLFKFISISLKRFSIIFGRKDSIGNFIILEDLIRLIIEIIHNKKSENKIYNFSQNFFYNDLLNNINKRLNKKSFRFYFYSKFVLKLYNYLKFSFNNFIKFPDIEFLTYRTHYNSSKIKKDLNFEFKEDVIDSIIKTYLINK